MLEKEIERMCATARKLDRKGQTALANIYWRAARKLARGL